MTVSVSCSGRLVADPDLRFTNSGKPVCSLRIATNKRVLDKTTNQWKNLASYFWNVISWNDAEAITENLRKGDLVFIQGEMSQREWEDKNGVKRVEFEITASNVGRSMRDFARRDESRQRPPKEEEQVPF